MRAAAAARLADGAIATRASLSRGVAGARAIAEKHGTETNAGTQTDLTEF